MRSTRAVVSREAEKPPAIEEFEILGPQADEVLIEISASGICHTDVMCHLGAFGTPKPIVLGHEGSGVVVETGPGVKGLRVGDHVVLTPASCGQCRACLLGKPTHCERVYELNLVGNRPDGSSAYANTDVRSHFQGQSSMATLAVASEGNAVKIADDLPLDIAAPLGCGVQTGAGAVLNALQVRPDTSIAIFGAGAVGLSALLAALASGVERAIVVDVVQSRLDVALSLGATDVVDASTVDTVGAVRDLTAGGTDYSVEASGNPAGLRGAVESLGLLGQCAVVGTAGLGAEGSFDWIALQTKGATIQGVCVGEAVNKVFIPQLADMYRRGVFPFDQLITWYDGIDAVGTALDDAGAGRVIKPVLRIS